MGVDFYACNYCGETFPDCGDFTMCECGTRWCCDGCAEAEGYQREEDGFTPVGSRWKQETSCQYCRQEDFADYELLNTALKLLDKTRSELIELHKKQIK